jgi:nitrite reductase/ring-hydroxylating ferredoxin subunit
MITEPDPAAPLGGCAPCLSRRGLLTAALAAGGAVLAGVEPADAVVARWTSVARRGEIRVGAAKVVAGPGDLAWIVTRPSQKVYRAFSAYCTHQPRAQTVVVVNEGRLYCPPHGSTFSMRTGERLGGPARRDLKEYQVRIRNRRIQVRG